MLIAAGSDSDRVAAKIRDAVGDQYSVFTGSKRGSAEFIEAADAREAMLTIAGLFARARPARRHVRRRDADGDAAATATRDRTSEGCGHHRSRSAACSSEAVVVAVVATYAGYLPGIALGHALGTAFVNHGIAPEGMAIDRRRQHHRSSPCSDHHRRAPLGLSSPPGGANSPTRACECAGATGSSPRRRLHLLGLVSACRRSRHGARLDLSQRLAVGIGRSPWGGQRSSRRGGSRPRPVVAPLAAWVPGALIARVSPVGGFLAVQSTRTSRGGSHRP